MTQAETGPRTIQTKPLSNIYTVLSFITVVALGVAVGILWWKNVALTQQFQPDDQFKHPFHIIDTSSH